MGYSGAEQEGIRQSKYQDVLYDLTNSSYPLMIDIEGIDDLVQTWKE